MISDANYFEIYEPFIFLISWAVNHCLISDTEYFEYRTRVKRTPALYKI